MDLEYLYLTFTMPKKQYNDRSSGTWILLGEGDYG